MSRRWLIAVSMVAHLAVGGAVFVSGIWGVERLSFDHRSPPSLAVMIPPSGGSTTSQAESPKVTKPEKPKVKPKTITKEPRQPRPRPEIEPPDISPPGNDDDGPGEGPGPGLDIPGEPGPCQVDCAPVVAAPICGNAAVETGEQCDDGNIAAGDGCSSTCRTEAPPPVNLRPDELRVLRLAGETQLHPSAATQRIMMRDQVTRTVATVKLCIAIDGRVTAAQMAKSTGYRDYDATILAAIQGWRYQPYRRNGTAAAACSTVTFIYSIR
jgi:TonB family protein